MFSAKPMKKMVAATSVKQVMGKNGRIMWTKWLSKMAMYPKMMGQGMVAFVVQRVNSRGDGDHP